MSDSEIDVAYVARLARLALTEEEAGEFQAEIGAILDHVRQLSDVDVSDIEPMAHATLITNITAADQPAATLDRAAVLANAPAARDDALIEVPVVIGEATVEGGA